MGFWARIAGLADLNQCKGIVIKPTSDSVLLVILTLGVTLLILLGVTVVSSCKIVPRASLDVGFTSPSAVRFSSVARASVDGPLHLWAMDAMTRVYRDQPVGDAAVCIAAARNEYEPFQVIISARGGDLTEVNASVSHFSGPAGVLSSTHVTLYREHYVHVVTPTKHSPYRAGWHPDALVPFRNPYTDADLFGPVYDAVPFTLVDGFNQPLWGDVFIPKGTPPGTYTSTLTVVANDSLTATLPVVLTVWGFTLPDRPYQRSSFGVGHRTLERVYGLDRYERPEHYYPLVRRYYHSLIAHRLMPGLLVDTVDRVGIDEATGHVNFDTSPYPGLGTNAAQNLDHYLNQLQVNAVKIPIFPDWPYPDALTSQREQTKQYLGDWGQYFAAHNWADRLYAYIVDEPNDVSEYQQVRDWGTLIHETNDQYGTSIKFLITEQPESQDPAWGNFYGIVDIWVPCCDFVWQDMDYSGGTRAISQRLTLGEEVWWYTALVQPSGQWMAEYGWPTVLIEDYAPIWLLDYPPMNFRVPSWLNQHYGFTGLLYWQTVYWDVSSDVWQDPATYRVAKPSGGFDCFNGEGSLLYPGYVFNVGFDGPVASMRLKWLREGIEDYDYVQMLSALGQRDYALSQVHSVVRNMGDWDMDPELLYAARRNMGERLHAIYAMTQYIYLPVVCKN